MKVPESYLGDDVLMEMVEHVEWLALRAWRDSAWLVMWRAWDAEQERNGAEKHLEGFGCWWDGEDEAAARFSEQLDSAINIIDTAKLWKGITGGSFDLEASIANWRNEPGMYGYVLTCHAIEEFEKLVMQMYPNDPHLACSYEAFATEYPVPGDDQDLDPDAVLSWAVEMMEKSGVAAAYGAMRRGVPLDDIVA